MAYINSILPETLDSLQLAYRPNRSTDDAISIALYTALSHLDKRNTYVRMLFIDSLTKDAGTKHLPLQLDPGLPDGPSPGGEGR